MQNESLYQIQLLLANCLNTPLFNCISIPFQLVFQPQNRLADGNLVVQLVNRFVWSSYRTQILLFSNDIQLIQGKVDFTSSLIISIFQLGKLFFLVFLWGAGIIQSYILLKTVNNKWRDDSYQSQCYIDLIGN